MPELIESFDAEKGHAQVEEAFGNVDVDAWDLPALWSSRLTVCANTWVLES